MVRPIICWLVILGVTGCHAPMPSFKPFAPYGSTRVPAPGTGSFGTPDPYYRPPGQPATVPNAQGSVASDPEYWARNDAPTADDGSAELNWTNPVSAGQRRTTSIIAPTPRIRDQNPQVRSPAVIRASYDERDYDSRTPAPSARPTPASNYTIIEPSAPREFAASRGTRPLRTNGVPFTDATGGEAPPLAPNGDNSTDIGRLPPTGSRERARLRGLNTNYDDSAAPAASPSGSVTRGNSGAGWKVR